MRLPRERHARSLRGICAAWFLTLVGSTGLVQAAPGPPSVDLERVQGLIGDLEDENEQVRHGAAKELRALSLDDLDEVLDVLLYRVVASTTSPTLSATAEELLLERLRTWPTEDVARACLNKTRKGELDEAVRGLELFSSFADARDWPQLLELCRSVNPEEVVHPLVSERLRRTFHAVIERDPQVLSSIGRTLDGAEPWLERAIVQALGQYGRGEALPLLQSLLDRDPVLDARILKALSAWKGFDARHEDCVTLVTDYLRAPTADVRRSAATALGRLGGGEAIPHLVLALDDGHSGVRRTALWSLRYITGIEFLTSSSEWLAWYEREETWRETSAPDLLVAAREGSVGEALPAVCELGRHPWFPDLAEGLAEAVHHTDPGVTMAACGALAKIGGPVALQTLLELCEDERPDVRQAARLGFEHVTGEHWSRAASDRL